MHTQSVWSLCRLRLSREAGTLGGSCRATQRDPVITTIRRENCGNGINCPALHRRENGRMIVSGPTVTDPDTLRELGLPDHESAVEFPAQLLSGAGLTLLGINDLAC